MRVIASALVGRELVMLGGGGLPDSEDFVEFIDGIKELFEVRSSNSQNFPTIFCKNFKTIDSSLIINSSCLF